MSAMDIINSFLNECIPSKKKQSTELKWKFTFEVTWKFKTFTVALCSLEKSLKISAVGYVYCHYYLAEFTRWNRFRSLSKASLALEYALFMDTPGHYSQHVDDSVAHI